jgi:hypothetical protein
METMKTLARNHIPLDHPKYRAWRRDWKSICVVLDEVGYCKSVRAIWELEITEGRSVFFCNRVTENWFASHSVVLL